MTESLHCTPETITTLVVNQPYTNAKFFFNVKKDLAAVYVSVLPMFSSNSAIISSLRFRFIIHFQFLFVYGVRECSNFILLLIYITLKWHIWKKNLKESGYIYICITDSFCCVPETNTTL